MGVSYNQKVITEGLVGYWDAGNSRSYSGSGSSVNDISGLGNNGTASNLTFDSNINSGQFVFNGTNASINFGTGSSLNVTSAATFEVIIYPTSIDSRGEVGILARGDGTNNNREWTMQFGTFNGGNSTYPTFAGPVSGSTLLSNTPVSLNTYYHLCVTFSYPGLVRMFLNGVLVASAASTGNLGTTAGYTIKAGQGLGGAQIFYAGKIPAIRIYNRTLSDNEVVANYKSFARRYKNDSTPQTYFPYIPYVTSGLQLFVDAGNPASYSGSGSTWTDLQGNYNLTLANSPTHDASTNGGFFAFNGSNQNAKNASINRASGTTTVMGSVKLTGGVNGRSITSINNNWLMGTWGGYVNQYYAEGWVWNPATAADTTWRIYTATIDTAADNYKFYSNLTKLADSNAGAAGPNGISIGSYGNNTEYSACQVGFVMVYNKVLSDNEITQNYNYFKTRYGLS